jgi:hypothetical protein
MVRTTFVSVFRNYGSNLSSHKVDKILRQQKHDHEVAEKAAKEQKEKLLPGSFISTAPPSSSPSHAPFPQPQLQRSTPVSSRVGGPGSSTETLSASEDRKLKSESSFPSVVNDKQPLASLQKVIPQPRPKSESSPSGAEPVPRRTGLLDLLPRIPTPGTRSSSPRPPILDTNALRNIGEKAVFEY